MLLPLDRDDASAFMSEDGDERFLEALLWHGLLRASDPDHTRPLTQERLVELSGLARNSVKAYASTKLRGVLEDGSSLSLDPEKGYALGIDLGRTHEARVVLTDLQGHYGDERDAPRRRGDGEEEFGPLEPRELRTAVELAWDVMESRDVTPDQLVGVGVGIATPSAPDVNAGNAAFGHWQRWASSGNLLRSALNARWEAKGAGDNAWSSVEFVDENDTNLSAIADYLWGGGQKCRSSLFVKWNAGVRAALVLDGCLYTGSAGYAGELPHVKVKIADEDRRHASRILDQECGSATCTVEGKKGCLYGIAPIEKISEIAGTEKVDQIIKRAGDPSSDYDELRIALKAAAAGIGSALAPLAIGINAEEIVIGGALGARAYPLVLDSLREGVESRARVAEFAVTNSTIRNRGTVRGAAALALLKFGPSYLKRVALAGPTNGSRREQGGTRSRRARRSPAPVGP